MLYHLGILQRVVGVLGGAIRKLLGTGRAESVNAAANIFVGQTEAPLVIRPYIDGLTRSGLFAVMVGGLSTVAGSVLVGLLAARGAARIPDRGEFHGRARCAADGQDRRAPKATRKVWTMISRRVPHRRKARRATPSTRRRAAAARERRSRRGRSACPRPRPADAAKGEYRNVIDAAAGGAAEGLKLALTIGAMLLAFISLIALINLFIGLVGGWFGAEGLSFEQILGYLFAPLMFVIGVPWSEAVGAGSFVGQKVVVNEFVAFADFAPQIDSFSPKAAAIVTFALTGFANLGSLGILLGGLGSLAPGRRSEIATLGLRAVAAATLANLMSAAIAGILIA